MPSTGSSPRGCGSCSATRRWTRQGAAELREIIESTGARAEIEQMIRVRADAARAALAKAPVAPESRVALETLTDKAIDRRR